MGSPRCASRTGSGVHVCASASGIRRLAAWAALAFACMSPAAGAAADAAATATLVAVDGRTGMAVFSLRGALHRVAVGDALPGLGMRLVHADSDGVLVRVDDSPAGVMVRVRPGGELLHSAALPVSQLAHPLAVPAQQRESSDAQ